MRVYEKHILRRRMLWSSSPAFTLGSWGFEIQGMCLRFRSAFFPGIFGLALQNEAALRSIEHNAKAQRRAVAAAGPCKLGRSLLPKTPTKGDRVSPTPLPVPTSTGAFDCPKQAAAYQMKTPAGRLRSASIGRSFALRRTSC